jgi:HK97 family phage portal protein
VQFLKRGHLQTRSIDSFADYPGLTEQLLAIQGITSATVTAPPSIRAAMAVPAVFRAVSMISNLIGSFTMQAWRNDVLLTNPVQVPRLVSRPGVFGTPRDFWRDTGYSLATRGEYIWWVADRDDEGLARGLVLLPSAEVTVSWNENLTGMQREYKWRNRTIDTDDIEHGFFLRDVQGLRGMGPLQLCGAALSAAVEADEWASRFFGRGGVPSVVLKTAANLSKEDSDRLVTQWLERLSNEVRVTGGGLEAEPFTTNPEQAQLLESRQHSAAAVATMFGMDADLLNAAVSGSSLTYQNVGQRLDSFIRTTLAPNYLEPIEHGISERLTRTTVGRFNLQALLRADVKTQAEVYSTLIAAGVPQSQAGEIAGLDSLVDTVPIPAPEPVRIEVPSN